MNAEGNRTAFERGHYFMANTTKNLTYPLLHLCSLLFSTCTFIFIFFKGRRKRINNPKRITNQEWIDASNLGWPFVPPPVVNLCLPQLLGWGYLKQLGNKKKWKKISMLQNVCLCMLKNSERQGCQGTEKTRKLSKIEYFTDYSSSELGPATHLLSFWASSHMPWLTGSKDAFFYHSFFIWSV